MRISGGTGVLESVTIFDDDNEKNPITLLFFDSAPASGTYIGNGVLALSTGDKAKYIGKVNIAAGDYETLGGDAFACIKGIGLGVQSGRQRQSVHDPAGEFGDADLHRLDRHSGRPHLPVRLGGR
jgi:hypothetical protein